MTKSELVEQMAKDAGISKSAGKLVKVGIPAPANQLRSRSPMPLSLKQGRN